MKIRRLITRRKLKWVGVIATVATLAVACGSIWIEAHVRWHNAEDFGCTVSAVRGQLHYRSTSFVPDGFCKPEWSWTLVRLPDPGFSMWFLVSSDLIAGMTFNEVRVPLWFVFLIVGFPTAWLWYTDRRAKPWQCPKCRYDLRGLERVRRRSGEVDSENRRTGGNGVCPECGRVVDQSNRREPSAD